MSTNPTAPSNHVVGVLGLGAMGGPMARHLVAAGYPVYVHDLNPAAVDALAALGAKPAGSPAALGENCDVVLVIVPTDEDLLDVCAGPDGILAHAKPGTVLLMCSSVRPDTCAAAAAAAPEGVEVLDAALTGGVRGAEEGVINLLVGGNEEALDRVRPALAPGPAPSTTSVPSVPVRSARRRTTSSTGRRSPSSTRPSSWPAASASPRPSCARR
jgi:3-hydroxyisobutyrate dehydrogenase-like beta-hydroxyacid dehydrogenase